MNGHEHIYELISLELDGALDAAGQRELEEHLASCGDCREMYGILRGVRETMDVEIDPPEELLAGVMKGVDRINRERRHAKAGRIGIAAGLLAAAAVLALVVLPKKSDAPNADGGIALYSLDGPETRDAVVDSGQTVGLFPGEVSIPVDNGQLEVALEGCSAVAYFQDIPDEILENGQKCVLSSGEPGYEITRELFDKYSGQAARIDYPDPEGEILIAVADG